jgi:hypothetical protein
MLPFLVCRIEDVALPKNAKVAYILKALLLEYATLPVEDIEKVIVLFSTN